MARKSNPSLFSILLHVFLTVVTGGFWLVILVIHHILKNR